MLLKSQKPTRHLFLIKGDESKVRILPRRWSKTTRIGFCIGFIVTVFFNLPALKLMQDDPVWNLAVVTGMGSGEGAIVTALVGFADGFIG